MPPKRNIVRLVRIGPVKARPKPGNGKKKGGCPYCNK